MKKALLFLLSIGLLSTHLWAQRIKYPTQPPKTDGFPPLSLQPYQSFSLSNGLQVFVVEDNTIPRVTLYTVFDYQPVFEQSKAGLSSIFGEMLRAGTKTKTKQEIDELIDFYGINLAFSSRSFSVFTLKKHLTSALDLLSEILLQPTFPEAELQKIKERTISALKAAESSPAEIAENIRKSLSYPAHPYGEVATAESIQAIQRQDLINFYNTYYRPNVAYMAIIGAISLDEAKKVVEQYFAKWEKADIPNEYIATPQAPKANQVAIAERTGAVQSTLRISYPIKYSLDDKNFLAARLVNQILGGGANARLFRNLREDKGYTYGAYSRLVADRWIGYFEVSTDVRNEVTRQAVEEILKEMRRLRDEIVSEDEIRRAKNTLIGSFARSLENAETIAQFAINTAIYRLPGDFYTSYIQRIESIKPQEIQFVARQFLLPSNTYIIGVGDVEVLQKALEGFGPIKRYDAYGREYKSVDASVLAGVSVDQIINNYINAIGGRSLVDKITSLKEDMSFELQGIKVEVQQLRMMGKFETQFRTPFGLQVLRYDGKKLLNKNPQGESIIDDPENEELKRSKSNAYVLFERDYQRLGYKASLTDAKIIDGKMAYEVTFESASGIKQKRYYDRQSGLLLEIADSDSRTVYQEYSQYNGIKLPSRGVAVIMGQEVIANMHYEINPDNIHIENIP